MKKLKKAILIVLAFVLCYVGVMIIAYDYLYEYPNGVLDTMEREDNARYFKVVYKTHLAEDKKTLLYFSRGNNGVGKEAHVGTLRSNLPDIVANFDAVSTSSYYIPVNAISWGVINNDTKLYYLFGLTTDQNTVRVKIVFTKDDETTKEYEMNYQSQCFYYIGFDTSWADAKAHIIGYNKKGGITFQYYGQGMAEGEYIEKDAK